ncbi:MAG: integrase core domain-containing protein, partial [Pseudomonadota bacterium]
LQAGFERWRHDYNHHRPHEALGLKTPASRYAISRRTMPHDLPAPIFQEDDILRKVRPNGCIKFQGQEIQLATAFAGQPVALRPTPKDGRFHVWFANFRIAVIDCRTAIDDVPSVTHLLERL